MISAQRKKYKAFSSVLIASTVLGIGLLNSCGTIQRDTATGSIPLKLQDIPYKRVHFPFDNDEVFLKEMDLVALNAEWLKKNRDAVVILEGHCDENGPSKYNMELGDRRARTVKAHLIENGVPHDRIIMVVSFGETRPLDPKHNSEAWDMNRRVEFILR